MVNEKHNLTLEEPSKEQSKRIESILNSTCNKQLLQRFAEALLCWIGKYDKVYKKGSEGKKTELKGLKELAKDSTTKYEIAQRLAFFLASDATMQLYIDSLNPKLRDLWRTILLFGYVSQDTAKDILGTKSNLFDSNRSYYYYSSSNTWNKREYGWWTTNHLRSRTKLNYGYSTYEDYITVSSVVRGLFFHHFFPELQHDNSTDTLPDGQWLTVDMETESLSAFNLFSSLYKQGELPMKKKGITAADMKRVNKKLALTEFFPGDNNEYRQYIRAYDYLGWLALNEHLKSAFMSKKVMTYQDTLRNLFNNSNNFDKFSHFLPSLLYPHVKGLRQNQTQWGQHGSLCKMMMSLIQIHPDKWMSISEIYKRIVEMESDGTSNIYLALVYRPSEEQNTAEITNLYSKQNIVAGSYAREFGYTGLKSFAFVLASLGMAEIAMLKAPEGKPPKAPPSAPEGATIDSSRITIVAPSGAEGGALGVSPFDAVEYIRLTPLGRYAMGVTKEYEMPKIKQEVYFELDPERLIIRSLKDPNPYEQLLRDTAEPISRGRFQTSALSFLSGCHSREDVEGKISIFKQFIANELPPLWEQFFQSLLQHCKPLEEDKASYRHYTLQPDNRELIHLITTDPTLRQLAIRAEGFRLLVRIEDIRKFENQLKKHGYLI